MRDGTTIVFALVACMIALAAARPRASAEGALERTRRWWASRSPEPAPEPRPRVRVAWTATRAAKRRLGRSPWPDARPALRALGLELARTGDAAAAVVDVAFFDPDSDREQARVLDREGVCALPRGQSDGCRLLNFALLGPDPKDGRHKVHLNAKAWLMPSRTFGDGPGMSQHDYRLRLLVHELAHALYRAPHPSEDPPGPCDPMTQFTYRRAEWPHRCTATGAVPGAGLAGGSGSVMGTERPPWKLVREPLGARGAMVDGVGDGRRFVRLATKGTGNCMVESILLAIAQPRDGRLHYREADATSPKSLEALREIDARAALQLRAAIHRRVRALSRQPSDWARRLKAAVAKEDGGLDGVLERLEPPTRSDGSVDERASARWLYDTTIQLCQTVLGVSLLFINEQDGVVYCRAPPPDFRGALDDSGVQDPERPLAAIVRWENGSHFTCLGAGRPDADGRVRRVQTLFSEDDPVLRAVHANMQCTRADSKHHYDI